MKSNATSHTLVTQFLAVTNHVHKKAEVASDHSKKNDNRKKCALVFRQNCSSELASAVAGGKIIAFIA